jgi:hypothetical protein
MTNNQYGLGLAAKESTAEKKAQKSLMAAFDALIAKHIAPAFLQARTARRVIGLLKTMLTMSSSRTIANTVLAQGQDQVKNWKMNYLAFSQGKWDVGRFFRGAFDAAVPFLPAEGPIVLAIDDTALPKSGPKIAHTRWVHSPLAPKWQHPALQWGLPEFHAALIVPTKEAHRVTAITVAFEPLPNDPAKEAKKKRRKPGESKVWNPSPVAKKASGESAPPPAPKKLGRPSKEEVARRLAAEGISHAAITDGREKATVIAKKAINRVRGWMNDSKMSDRMLLVVGDGSYSNKTVMVGLPENTIFAGRVRPDAKLCALSTKSRAGVPEYGEALPTPEEMGKDLSIPEITGMFDYGGDLRELRFKCVGPVYWEGSTRKLPLRLLILQPVPFGEGLDRGYNRRAFLLTTDHQLDPAVIINAYLQRWQIEVLHRDLKSAGLGQASVQNPQSVARLHSALAALYGILLIAILKTQGQVRTDAFGTLPRWRVDHREWWKRKRLSKGKSAPIHRPSVADITTLLRRALNGHGHGLPPAA